MQLLLYVITSNIWLGATFAIAFFLARELTQAEYRYISDNGGKRYETPLPAEFGSINPKYWDLDSILDFLAPSIVVILLALIL